MIVSYLSLRFDPLYGLPLSASRRGKFERMKLCFGLSDQFLQRVSDPPVGDTARRAKQALIALQVVTQLLGFGFHAATVRCRRCSRFERDQTDVLRRFKAGDVRQEERPMNDRAVRTG